MLHRLLKKRLLSSPKQQEENQIEPNGDTPHCHCEWLVKWCGLDYEYATWELESAAFLQSPLAQSLMRKYENRHQRAKRATSSSLIDKVASESEYAINLFSRLYVSSRYCVQLLLPLTR